MIKPIYLKVKRKVYAFGHIDFEELNNKECSVLLSATLSISSKKQDEFMQELTAVLQKYVIN